MGFDVTFEQIRPAYEIPEDDLIGEVLVPAMRTCEELRLGVGFFSSRCLAQIAPGLASFVNDTGCTLDMMVSPEISQEDQEAIRRGVREPAEVLNDALLKLFEGAFLSPSAIERHTLETLEYLVASERLRIRVILMPRGMYHKKIWLFRSGQHWLAVHGSGNATERGLLVNGEQMSIDRAWVDGQQSQVRVNLFLDQWARQWENRNPSSLTVEVDEALDFLSGYARNEPPTAADFWAAWHQDYEMGIEPSKPSLPNIERIDQRLKVPESLVWREGRFAHQGRAVDALVSHGGGIVAIATGGGKTKTALIAASEMQDTEGGHVCVVILAPTRPLVRQWTDEVRGFGIEPVVLSGMNAGLRTQELERVSVAFTSHEPRTEVFLLTNALFTRRDSAERRWLQGLPDSVTRILIADEVHNLGARSFTTNLPDFFRQRIGLSATPVRQYDPDGTDQLFDFFGGPPQFEFSLGEAIKAGCLVPYEYYIHPVEFQPDEMERYQDLTERLIKAGFQIDDDGRTVGLTDRVASLLRDRRALVEQADAKISSLARELERIGTNKVARTLIYASAKATVDGKTRQIMEVNRVLERLNVISHQYTSEETSSKQSRSILDRFGAGDYQVLTAMKVLDEGIDIPQTDTAFLLASSTVEREGVQRRGRILRQAPGKDVARLHDFIVVPPCLESPAAKSLLRSELRRASAFADLAENEYDPDGANTVIRQLENELWGL